MRARPSAPDGELISLAVTVERYEDGDYFWAILESFDHSMAFEPLMEAAAGFASYAEALDAGAAVLKSLSADPDAGPLEESDVSEDD